QGVKCHVSCDMARCGNAGSHRSFQNKENNLFRLRAETCDSRWLVFVFVSGTVVAPIESCELSRFEIPRHSRSKLNVHFASVRRIRDARIETGAAKDQYR